MKDKASLLIVDDEEKLCHYLKKEFVRKGYQTHVAHEGRHAFRVLSGERVDVVLLDIYLPGKDGMEILQELRRSHPAVQVIMLTGNATVDTALQSMKLGAYDYLTKPYNFEELCLLIDKAYGELLLRRENELLRLQLSQEARSHEFVGDSPRAREVLDLAGKAASSDASVLIVGETGTGKEIVSRLIHDRGSRREGPFLAMNCSAFQETLLESELFGHEQGAFTDAHRCKHGLVEMAHGGTLFLDEIGDMTTGVQAKLLRFLDSGEFRRLGGTATLKAELRVLSATHADLQKAIREGRFREDLYYRLNVMTIRMPPLRERVSDIPRIAAHFLKRRRASSGAGARRFSSGALELLKDYPWPGNVRELENIIERAIILSEGESISRETVHQCLSVSMRGYPNARNDTLEEMERCHILKILTESGGNKAKAARTLDIDTKTLYNKLKQYGIPAAGEQV